MSLSLSLFISLVADQVLGFTCSIGARSGQPAHAGGFLLCPPGPHVHHQIRPPPSREPVGTREVQRGSVSAGAAAVERRGAVPLRRRPVIRCCRPSKRLWRFGELKNQERPTFWTTTSSLVLFPPGVRWGHAVPLPVRNTAPRERRRIVLALPWRAYLYPPINDPVAIYGLTQSGLPRFACCTTFRKGPGCAPGARGAVGHPVCLHPAFRCCFNTKPSGLLQTTNAIYGVYARNYCGEAPTGPRTTVGTTRNFSVLARGDPRIEFKRCVWPLVSPTHSRS